MAQSRFLLHPLFSVRRSRVILFYFLGVALMMGSLIWWQMTLILKNAGVSVLGEAVANNKMISLLLSPHFRVALIFISGILGSAVTARFVVGPVKRIEQWIAEWSRGEKLNPLKVRDRDKFSRLVELINKLYSKLEK